jgi:preprotein translocase subunit SecD
MGRGNWGRWVIILSVTLGSIWYLIPTYYSFFVLPKAQRNDLKLLQSKLPRWAPGANHRLNLGLDLQGGIHMVMRVDTQTALQKRVERRGLQIVNYLRDQKIEGVTYTTDPNKLQLTLKASDAATLDKVEKELKGFDDFTRVGRGGDAITYQLKDTQVSRFRDEAVDQAMLVIRRRIDKWGVAEVDVRKMGTDSIQISLPGQQDPEQAKELIGTTAQLEFRMVDERNPYFSQLVAKHPPPADSGIRLVKPNGYDQLEGKDREALLAYARQGVPADREVLLQCMSAQAQKGTCDSYLAYLVDKAVPLTGESLATADYSRSQTSNDFEVNLSFDTQGGIEFGKLTGDNVGRYMAIVLDENVNSAPRINERIPNGRARITLGHSIGKTDEQMLQEALNLVLVLRAGALPAPVTTGEIRQVGASLGDELIRKGSLAATVGLALVVVFMAVYYRKSGLIADVALILNGVLILAGLALFNATLTLPGIAGFVLTLGIAVDANVLINERVREELAAGKSARAAVDQGYDRAFWTIFDAHVTTLIAGFILLSTGTGPVRGFATSLIIGLVASLFTSIVVTRAITTYFVHGRGAQTVSV